MAVTVNTARSEIDKHRQLLRARSRQTHGAYVLASRLREAIFGGIAVIGAVSGLIGISLAMKYAGSIAMVSQTRQVDSYGQLIGRTVSVQRVPASMSSGILITDFLTWAMLNYHSSLAMLQFRNDALSIIAQNSPAQTQVDDLWNAPGSGMNASGAIDLSVPERNVTVTSILDHGKYGYHLEDYLVQVRTTSYSNPVQHDLWTGDIVVTADGPHTDLSPWGLYIYRVALTRVQ